MSQYYSGLSGKDIKVTSFDVTGNHKSLDTSKWADHTAFDFKKSSTPSFSFGGKSDQPNYVTIKSSIETGDKQHYVGVNAFVRSCFLAYSEHQRIVLRPDDVWIAIMTQFSFYINVNSEKLRSKLIDFQGKKELEVVADANLLNAPYDEMTLAFTELIARNLKDQTIRDWSMPAFTTTTNTDRVVGAACLMATMKNYFCYKYSLCCGLPSVTLLGSIDDWKLLKEKAQRLVEFDTEDKLMTKWTAMLLPILDKFIESVEGKPDTEWWNRIASHVGGGSGPTWLSGWITVFTAFTPDGKWLGDEKVKNSWCTDLTTEWLFVDCIEIACGFVELPVTIDDNGTPYSSKLFGGHYTVKFFDQNQTIVPQLNWCIAVKDQLKASKLNKKQ